MPRIDNTKEATLKKEIRTIIAIDPLISAFGISGKLAERGYRSSSGGLIDNEYVLKLVKKINGEGRYDIKNTQIEDRMVATRERFQAIFNRLFKIAFWEWNYMNEGIMMPEVKDQIKAMEVIMKMDIALIEAEMDAGIFKRQLGTLEVERRNIPLLPEKKQAIIVALQNWGLIPQTEHATAQSTTDAGGDQRPA